MPRDQAHEGGPTDEYGSTRFLPLLAAIHELLRDYPIRSAIGSIRVLADESWRELVVVNLASGLSLATLTRAVIEWRQTLGTPTIAAERSGCGATLRLGLLGHTNDVKVEVWGEIPYDSGRTGLLIDPGERTSLSLDDIAGWLVGEWMRGDGEGVEAPDDSNGRASSASPSGSSEGSCEQLTQRAV
jgi:hypothetical protein